MDISVTNWTIHGHQCLCHSHQPCAPLSQNTQTIRDEHHTQKDSPWVQCGHSLGLPSRRTHAACREFGRTRYRIGNRDGCPIAEFAKRINLLHSGGVDGLANKNFLTHPRGRRGAPRGTVTTGGSKAQGLRPNALARVPHRDFPGAHEVATRR